MQIPIRKRAYWRAVKRNEPWAMEIHKNYEKNPLQWRFAFTYRNLDLAKLVFGGALILERVSPDTGA